MPGMYCECPQDRGSVGTACTTRLRILGSQDWMITESPMHKCCHLLQQPQVARLDTVPSVPTAKDMPKQTSLSSALPFHL